MRGRAGRGRRGPGLLGTAARTAVIAGTASSVAGRVSASQDAAARQRHEAEQAQAQVEAWQRQQDVDARVADAVARTGPAAGSAPGAQGAQLDVDELYTRLMKLGELKQAGLLDDEEFGRQKARLLGG
ncbi:hypothetical protein GCM10023328_27220 [Modestobacter marinus]|uniref:SHOCT domain-containing protein n=1 Tax=Modestobacter marinus TaxID=477641 RepID=A0A846LWF0_9ACTN|nr:SHOCT domain-containing protein [Modestobacter marinus]NIH69838.1 hypothetical protein [Modestobacter marinus]GGL81208.1 hypothetical protein GCM10011589_41860 [Modestobacter marinus]